MLHAKVQPGCIFYCTEALAKIQHVNCMIVQIYFGSQESCMSTICYSRPVARGGGGGGGGVGGVATPPSGINDIHITNYLFQERPFDCSSLASEPQIAPEALSWHKHLRNFMQHASRPPRYIHTVPPLSWIPGFACMPL